MKSLLLRLIIIAVVCIPHAVGAALGADHKQELLFVLNGMKKERAALKRGICQMTGRSIFKALGGDYEDMEGELSIFSAFDDRGQIRFDRTQPGWVPDGTTAKVDPKNPGVITSIDMKKGIVSHKYYKNIKRAGYWQVGSSMINLSADEKKLPLIQVNYFDVKALGLYYWRTLHQGLNIDDMIADRENMKTLSSIDKSDPSIWAITWSVTTDVSNIEWTMWVDVKHGFAPVRHEYRERLLGRDSWWMNEAYKTKWNQKNDVWVPIHHEIMKAPIQGKWRHEIAFDVKWESVNEPISDDVFDYNGFGAPTTVSVVDVTLSQPVLLNTSLTPPEKAHRTKKNRGYRPVVLSSILSAVLIVVILYFAFRRKKNAAKEIGLQGHES